MSGQEHGHTNMIMNVGIDHRTSVKDQRVVERVSVVEIGSQSITVACRKFFLKPSRIAHHLVQNTALFLKPDGSLCWRAAVTKQAFKGLSRIARHRQRSRWTRPRYRIGVDARVAIV